MSGVALLCGCQATGEPAISTSAVSVRLDPPDARVAPGGVELFRAAVIGTADPAVNWSVQEAGGGSVTSGGAYTAPLGAGSFHVVATSRADPTRSASALVMVSGGSGTSIPAGAITTQTWSAAGSPYRIYGDVFIPSGNKLTILPGVQVRFQGHYRLEGPGIIDARGTSPAQRDILFTAEDPQTGWYGIRIWNGNGSYAQAPDVGDYHLQNAIIEYVVKDRSSPRSFGDASYNDSRGALYVLGMTSWDPVACPATSYCGLKASDLHLDGLTLRHNRALVQTSPASVGGALYFNSLSGAVEPVWTDVVFDDNQTVQYGGAFAQHHGGPVTFRNCTMTGNVATAPTQAGAGGAVGYWDVSGPTTLTACVYTANTPAGFATAGAPPVVVVQGP